MILTPYDNVTRLVAKKGVDLITVIMPTLNEESELQRVLPHLDVEGVDEVIVVDGGSQDATAKVARSMGARLVVSAPGRGVQEAAGAVLAKSPIILFLHADTLLPSGFVAEIEMLFRRQDVVAGAFRLGIDVRQRPILRFIEFMANTRSQLLSSPYGDQAIFVRSSALHSVGGVPKIPLLEDVRMIKALKQKGRILMSKKSVMTSGRAWQGHGALRTTAANLSVCAGHWAGVDPVRLAAWRRRLLPPSTVMSS